MHDDPDLAWLRDQVDRAVGDVRRSESVGPAAALAALVTGVPLLVILVVAALLHAG